jgi:hypothetical protein
MKRVNQYQFYQLATEIHSLTQLKDGGTSSEVWVACFQARAWLDFLLSGKLMPLVTSRKAAQQLRAAINEAVPDSSSMTRDERTQKLAQAVPASATWQIRSTAQNFETAFAAEMETVDTYLISQKGIYFTNSLIEKAEEAFTEQVRAEFTAHVINDIRQAGKCLAFDLDTASGFHICRATEGLIHRYYVAVTGSTPKRKDRNWGAYVRNLKAHKNKNANSKADPTLIALIDQVREHHRNPVIDPEIMLTADEAQSLFSICQAVIISFARALKAISPPWLNVVGSVGSAYPFDEPRS